MSEEEAIFMQEWTLEDWEKDWQGEESPWRVDEIYWPLEKHLDKLTDGKPSTFFVPCAGDMVDMKWLMDRGHSVIAADVVESAAVSFCKRCNIEHDVENVKGYGKLYKSRDGKLKFYVGDVLKFTRELCHGDVDAIYDVGAMQAINPSQRSTYIDMEYNVLKTGGYLLVNLMGMKDVPDDAEVVPPVFQSTYDKLVSLYHHVERIERYKMEQFSSEESVTICNFYLCTTK